MSEIFDNQDNFEKPLTGPQAAKLLGIKHSTFKSLVKKNIISALPGLKSCRLFSKKELKRYSDGERK